jgi:S-adenosylmethionine:diacylglycerol 3-amino-3-carboxypropyl transferase
MKFLYNFGISQDDPETERKALGLKKGDRLLCIASAGEVPLDLLSTTRAKVHAVDISTPQLYLSKLKLAAALHLDPPDAIRFIGYKPATAAFRYRMFDQIKARLESSERAFWKANPIAFESGPVHCGRFEQYISNFNKIALLILNRSKMKSLIELDDIKQQKQYFDNCINTGRLKIIFRLAFHPRIYKKRGMDEQGLTHRGERNIAEFFFNRFRDFCTSTPARENHLLQLTFFNRVIFDDALPAYLREEGITQLRDGVKRLVFYHGDIMNHIRNSNRGQYNKFALSNLGDWLTRQDMNHLFKMILEKTGEDGRILLRYIHYAHPIPDEFKEKLPEEDELGRELESIDRYPFYSLRPIRIIRNHMDDGR